MTDTESKPTSRRVLGLLLGLVVGNGVGHLARGRFLRGAAWCLAGMGLYAVPILAGALGRPRMMWLGLAAWVLLRIVVAVDGFVVAARPTLPSWWSVVGLSLAFVGAGQVEAHLFRGLVVEAFRCPSASMSPTLLHGDHFFIRKLGAPRRGDVVVFLHDGRDYVKRLVALAGDEIEIRAGTVFVNGEAIPRRPAAGECAFDERHAADWTRHPCREAEETLGGRTYRVLEDPGDARRSWPAFRVPPGMAYVLGDNRDNSHDSRHFGAVPVAAIQGRATFIYWSSGPAGLRRDRFNLLVR